MAKGKHAVALFEVIQSSKSSRKGVSLRTPKWWFKGKATSGAPESSSAASSAASAATSAGSAPTALPPSAPALAARHADHAPSAPIVVVEPAITASVPAPRATGIDLRLDPDRQRISFNFTYTSAIVTTFAVLVVVGLAYIIGRHVANGPTAALAGPSSEEIRKGPVKAGVLDVKSNSGELLHGSKPAGAQPQQQQQQPRAGSANTGDADDAIRAMPPTQTPQQQQARTGAGSTTQPAGRVIGLNYVVVQSYPDEKSAIEARELLIKNNVPATVEKGLPYFTSPTWFSVVGLTGFERIRNNSDYDKYMAHIRQVSEDTIKNQRFKRFEPQPYRWKGT
jgi:hypothetical protein